MDSKDEDNQADTLSCKFQWQEPPLRSEKTFQEMNLPINFLRGIEAMGFEYPSRIQEICLVDLLADPPRNMIAQSQSGTGKTMAFLAPCLSRVKTEYGYPQCLIILPTYELVFQIIEVAKSLAKFMPGLTVRSAVGGETPGRGQIREHMLIGTLGTVFNYHRHGMFDVRNIRVFVIDEANAMLSNEDNRYHFESLYSNLLPVCQMLLFSNTYTIMAMELAKAIIIDPIVISLPKNEELLGNVKQYFITYNLGRKSEALMKIFGFVPTLQTIVFCQTRNYGRWLQNKLIENGHEVMYTSGSLPIDERCEEFNRFRKGNADVLITTDVCAYGIDIRKVTLVVNYDFPVLSSGHADCETYLSRIGRAGRFGMHGIAVSLVWGERDMENLKEIEKRFEKPILPLEEANFFDVDDVLFDLDESKEKEELH